MKGIHDVGYTTGVFDVLHIEHLDHLAAARDLCDFLVVGVLTDELALELTGAVPVNPYAERLEIIRCLRSVDAAVGQLTPDAVAVWHQLRFSRLLLSELEPGVEPGSTVRLPAEVQCVTLRAAQRSRSTLVNRSGGSRS
jgi:glycerol-3-phosphate cytidylyltransferase